MKRYYYILTLGLLAGLASCSDDVAELLPQEEQGISRIYASIDDEMAETRTMLVNDKKVFWEKDDAIGVIPTADFSGGWYIIKYQNDGYFEGGDIKGGIPAGTYFASYPVMLSAQNDGKKLLMKLDEQVVHKENSFSQPMPMFAGSTDFASGHLSFNLAAGAIRVALTGSFKVTQITLEGNNGEQLSGVGFLDTAEAKPSLSMSAGTWTLGSAPNQQVIAPGSKQVMTMGSGVQLSASPTSFYFVVPPTNFTKGITVTIEGEGLGHPIVKTTTHDVKVNRGAMKSFTAVDTDAILQAEADEQLTALKAMFNSLGGANWTKKWDISKPLTDAAAWPGVTADTHGMVTKIDLSNNGLSGMIPAEIGKLTVLENINLSGNNIEGGIPKEVANITALKSFNVKGNKMNGEVAKEVYTSDVWAHATRDLTQQSGFALKTKYVSSDYSKDGDHAQILTHTIGPGIPVVITCDAFSDDKYEDFKKLATTAMNYFFSIAPYKDFKDYFDVYRLMAVSANNEVDLNLAYGTKYEGDTYTIDDDKVRAKIEGSLGLATSNLLSIVLLNEVNEPNRARCFMVTDGFATAIAPVDEDLECIIHHEAGGHGFAFLGDEYFSDGTGTYGAAEKADLDQRHGFGWALNLSYYHTNTTVPWKDFWTDAAYASESVGAYEGGDGAYAHGVYRSTENSTMNDQYAFDKFNPQSRWLIFRQISQRAGAAATMEAFKKYDAPNIAYMPSVGVVTRNYVEKKTHKLGAPPVWKEKR